ncbi:MAG: phosphate/phosphite/phosphonate ABC transporter substrate-binding protein [Thermodesulfovibrionales bacterium]|nr:phosphate/phosphite/phosphonate ABC transporter substrate-binding protein [Thermodesulfovibrionales bacterium]
MKTTAIILTIIFFLISFKTIEAKDTIVFAVSPMASPAATATSFSDFINFMSKKLNKKVVLKQRKKYADINEMLKNGEALIAFTCTGAYLAGREDFGLELFVVPVVDGKTTYHSYIIVHKGSHYKNLEDLKGKVFAFTDPLSLSGRLYVTSLLNEKGIHTKDYFKKTFYTAGHEKSIEIVAQRLADGASIDSLILEDMIKKDNPYSHQVKVIAKSPPFGMPPFVVSPQMPEDLRKRLLKILLSMQNDKEGSKVLQKIGINGFKLPNHSDYISAFNFKKKVLEK